MEPHINIEETTYPNIVQRIDKNVLELPSLNPECFIYKVHKGLRKVKREAYVPMLVSIGPYHLGNNKLDAMKTHKLRYLRSLLERKNEKTVERYFVELAKLEDKARKCYVDPIDLKSSDEFVEMMLLDGCFIIEYFHKIFYGVIISNDDDPILSVHWMKSRICLDMMLLENQLPYFVLSQLYDMTKNPQEGTFRERAMLVFNNMLPKPCGNFEYVGGNDTVEIKHLLHLIYILCGPSYKERITKNSDEVLDQNPLLSEERITKNGILYQISSLLLKCITKYCGNDEILNQQMRSVVELQEAGVKFKKAGAVSFFDIKFNNGLMEIPCFNVEDYTDTFFRNLIAYEQHYSDVNPKYFTDFAVFMDQLINSEKDVKLLRLKGIIVNLLGDDKEVSDLFNKLGDGVIISSNSYYSKVRKRVKNHCERPWNEMKAKLRGDYFNNPWASVSTIAAGVLLLLTVAQTIAAYIYACELSSSNESLC